MHAASNRHDPDAEMVITRVVNAPRELVWRVWTDPKHLPNWWGPRGFTNRTRSHDLRVGGSWRHVMIGPDGREYENLIYFDEIVEPERLCYRHTGEKDTESVNFTQLVTFEQEGQRGERTRVTVRNIFRTKRERDFVVEKYNAVEGGRQHLARLDEYVQQLASGTAAAAGASFIITRVVAAPRALVWQAWTEESHLARWFGPKGCEIVASRMDLRAGGSYHYGMRTPDGRTMWGLWEFRDIIPCERIVLVSSFSDEHRGLTRHPMNAGWPLKTLSTMTLAEHAGAGLGTTLELRWEPIDASEAELKVFAESHASMQAGWAGTFEQLTAYLARLAGH
jgi:uncharacterized protein YndB with AHSA1/START domain